MDLMFEKNIYVCLVGMVVLHHFCCNSVHFLKLYFRCTSGDSTFIACTMYIFSVASRIPYSLIREDIWFLTFLLRIEFTSIWLSTSCFFLLIGQKGMFMVSVPEPVLLGRSRCEGPSSDKTEEILNDILSIGSNNKCLFKNYHKIGYCHHGVKISS